MILFPGISKRLIALVVLTLLLGAAIALLLPRLIFPQQPRLTDAVMAEMFPFQSRYVELDNGAIIHYIDEGKGPALLLLHGNPTSAFLYRHLIADLRADFRVIALDYPGFGQSTAPYGYTFTAEEQAASVVRFFDTLDLQDTTVMVQDWGGPIGFYLAQSRTDKVRGLVIGNTWAWPLDAEFRYRAFSWIMGGPIGRAITKSRLGVVHIFLKRGVLRQMPDDEYEAYFQAFLQGDSTGVTTFPRELISATPFLKLIEEKMHSLKDLKTLIVWGEADFAFGPAFRERFESNFAKHRTVSLPNAGHFIQEDAPHEIARGIREVFGESTWK